MVVLVALPLAGSRPERAPILTPIGMEPVPLDAGLQGPPGSPFQLASLLAPGRFVLGPMPSPALALNLYISNHLHITSAGFRDRRATCRSGGRSPPSA
jgi:hypothetical protein